MVPILTTPPISFVISSTLTKQSTEGSSTALASAQVTAHHLFNSTQLKPYIADLGETWLNPDTLASDIRTHTTTKRDSGSDVLQMRSFTMMTPYFTPQ